MLFLHFGWYLEYFWVHSDKIKCILSRKTRERHVLSFGDFCWLWVCFDTAAFDTDTFQRANLYQKDSKAILSSIWWYYYFVCRVTDKFRVMIDLLRDGSACPVSWKTLRFSGLKGDMFETFYMNCTKYSLTRLNLSASCWGGCLNWAYRHLFWRVHPPTA